MNHNSRHSSLGQDSRTRQQQLQLQQQQQQQHQQQQQQLSPQHQHQQALLQQRRIQHQAPYTASAQTTPKTGTGYMDPEDQYKNAGNGINGHDREKSLDKASSTNMLMMGIGTDSMADINGNGAGDDGSMSGLLGANTIGSMLTGGSTGGTMTHTSMSQPHRNSGGLNAASPSSYLDPTWAAELVGEANNEMLYGMDFSGAGDLNLVDTMNFSAALGQFDTRVLDQARIGVSDLGDHKQTLNDASLTPHSSSNQQSMDTSQLNPELASMSNPGMLQSKADAKPRQKKAEEKKTTPAKTTTKQRRPCDHCRRRKIRCVLAPNSENCVQCEAKSISCTFLDLSNLAKRKMDEQAAQANKKGKLNDKESRLTDLTDPNFNIINNEVVPNVPIRDIHPVQDYSSMNNSLLKKTLSLQFPRSSFYVGPTSYMYDINLLNLIIEAQYQLQNNQNNNSKIEQVNLSNTISLRKVSDKVQFILKDDQSAESYQTMSNDVDTIEKFIAPHGQILIDLYFRIIHPSYPILHKKVFLEKYSRTHREFSAPLLAAVYVLAIQWWDYDPQLNRFPKPNVELILKIGLNNYLLEILKRPKLSAVQAGLLLLQCKHIIQAKDSATMSQFGNLPGSPPSALYNSVGNSDYSDWVLGAQVLALAEELGLGMDCNNWKLPKWERGLRKRLAWAAYMEDKWLSLKNGRPSHINENNWVVVNLIEQDFPEKHGDGDLKEGSSDIDNGKKIFMNLIQLTTILSDILNRFYSMKAMQEIVDLDQVLMIAKPLQLRLRNWYQTLPDELLMNSMQPRKLCSNGYLQLAYFATELTLHRKIITVIYQQSQHNNPPLEAKVKVCRTAARTRLIASIEFVKELKPEHIHSFWHSSAASNFTLIGTFAALLFISSTSKEESDFYKDQIFNYRWILRISSKGFDHAGEALHELDLILNRIPGLLNDSIDLPMVVPIVPTVDYRNRPSARAGQSNPQLQHLQGQQTQQNRLQQQQQQQPQQQLQQQKAVSSPMVPNDGGSRNSPGVYPNRPVQSGQRRVNSNQGIYPSGGRPQNVGSPYSPQNFSSPSFSQVPPFVPNSNTMSRGGQFVVNSPQSSQGLSPKEIIKQQRPVMTNGASLGGVGSKGNSPIMVRSPNVQQATPNIPQNDDNSDVRSLHNGK